MLAGARGEGVRSAMRIVTRIARIRAKADGARVEANGASFAETTGRDRRASGNAKEEGPRRIPATKPTISGSQIQGSKNSASPPRVVTSASGRKRVV